MIAGCGTCTFGLLVTGIPIGAGDCLVMIACCIFFIFKCEYPGIGSPLNYKGPTANASGKAGFSGKIPEPPARMIFSETACGLTLPSDKKRLPTLPCSSRFANVCVFSPFPFLPVSFPVVTDTKRAARSRTAPLCCNDKFRACSISSDFRRPENSVCTE